MWLNFFLENGHFAINLIAALVFFAVFWLYLDALSQRKNLKGFLRCIGLLFIAISFVLRATQIESVILAQSLFSSVFSQAIFSFFKIGGYILLIISLNIDPLIPRPIKQGEEAEGVAAIFTIR